MSHSNTRCRFGMSMPDLRIISTDHEHCYAVYSMIKNKINLSETKSYVFYIHLHISILFYFSGEQCIFVQKFVESCSNRPIIITHH